MSATTNSTWSQAIDIFNKKLTRDNKKRLATDQQPVASFDDVLALARDGQKKMEANKWKFKNVAIRDKVESLLSRLHSYAAVGDVVVQHHPEYSALAWGAFRLLLQASHHALTMP